MIHKLVHTQEPIQAKYVEDVGHYNELPKPNTLSDFDEFWNKFSNYIPTHEEFRQIRLSEGNRVNSTNFRIYYFHDCAYAVSRNKTVYRIGCEHKYKVISTARCYVEYECEKCGVTYEVDSSD
jgi:hypothetical protein